jgi:hypothetical protein
VAAAGPPKSYAWPGSAGHGGGTCATIHRLTVAPNGTITLGSLYAISVGRHRAGQP